MIKNKVFLFFAVAIFLNFCLINKSHAIQDTGIINKFPDYAYEFTGNDPWEKFNRKVFVFNLKANKYVIRPVNIVWASIIPQYGMDRIENFYNNLSFPVRLVGGLLQKDFTAAGQETKRFLINTTIGLAGLYDPAKSKFKLDPREEDIEQALAYHKVKQGPYLVLPIVAQGNMRDLGGQLADVFLNPCFYIAGPVTAISAGVSVVNGSTYMQPIVKMIDDTYADPYEVSKQLYGLERYIKKTNMDRKDVYLEKATSQNVVKINNISEDSNLTNVVQPDIQLDNFKSQGSIVDSMRSMLFDNKKLDKSMWSELSVWNKTFNKRIKTSSISLDYKHPKYEYRYILQKDKTAPVAILYPSIGESIMSSQSTVLAKILYDEGYSVIIQGSHFQWEFVKSMPDGYKPGLPSQDAYYLRKITSIILNDIQAKYAFKFDKKIIVGSSFGGMATLFVAAQEENENTLGISNYISINPPIEIFFALKQLDKYCEDWKNNPSDIKPRAAITAEKVIQVSQRVSDEKVKNKPETLPLNKDEAELAMGFVMKQKLSDVIFTIEKGSRSEKNDLYKTINNMSFYDYAKKYLIADQNESTELLNYDSSLYSLSDFLQKNNKYKIYHSLDDCFVNPEQLSWLKEQTHSKSVFFSNGSHLGFLYRKEFFDEFKKDTIFKSTASHEGI